MEGRWAFGFFLEREMNRYNGLGWLRGLYIGGWNGLEGRESGRIG